MCHVLAIFAESLCSHLFMLLTSDKVNYCVHNTKQNALTIATVMSQET